MRNATDLQREAYESMLVRNLGGKSVFANVISSVGSSNLVIPAAGKAVEVYWVYAVPDPDSDQSPVIRIKLGTRTLYCVAAISHWEVFRGLADETLSVELSEAAPVAVTVHYKEI